MLANNKRKDLANSLIRDSNFDAGRDGKESDSAGAGCLTSCTHYVQDYPYSFFSIRRRAPN